MDPRQPRGATAERHKPDPDEPARANRLDQQRQHSRLAQHRRERRSLPLGVTYTQAEELGRSGIVGDAFE